MRNAMIMAAVVTLALSSVSHGDDFDASLYTGLKSCRMCHRKDNIGNQFAAWEEGPHAKTHEMLGSEEAKAVAKKLGIEDPQKNGKCLKCHATAYSFTEEVQTDVIDVGQGVVCESCHGPGKNYKKKSVMKDTEKACAAGLIKPATKNCARCHNETSPTWKADRYTKKDGTKVGFDVEQAYEKIKHPRPKSAE